MSLDQIVKIMAEVEPARRIARMYDHVIWFATDDLPGFYKLPHAEQEAAKADVRSRCDALLRLPGAPGLEGYGRDVKLAAPYWRQIQRKYPQEVLDFFEALDRKRAAQAAEREAAAAEWASVSAAYKAAESLAFAAVGEYWPQAAAARAAEAVRALGFAARSICIAPLDYVRHHHQAAWCACAEHARAVQMASDHASLTVWAQMTSPGRWVVTCSITQAERVSYSQHETFKHGDTYWESHAEGVREQKFVVGNAPNAADYLLLLAVRALTGW